MGSGFTGLFEAFVVCCLGAYSYRDLILKLPKHLIWAFTVLRIIVISDMVT